MDWKSQWKTAVERTFAYAQQVKVTYNAPVVLTFTLLAGWVLLMRYLLGLWVLRLFSASGDFHLFSPLSYLGMVSYVLGHIDLAHFVGNFMIILLVGPLLEERNGSQRLLIMIFVTTITTGILNTLLFSHGILGASGVAFMMLILASCVNIRRGEIPTTLLVAASLYFGQELMQMSMADNISQFGHILGGICGAIFGLIWHPKKEEVPSPVWEDTAVRL